MKRKIKDLKPHEAIEIKSAKEAKYLAKQFSQVDDNADDKFNRAFDRIGFPFLVKVTNTNTITWGGTKSIVSLGSTIIPASEFMKPNKVKKRVKELEDMVTQLDGRVKQLENLWAKEEKDKSVDKMVEAHRKLLKEGDFIVYKGKITLSNQ